MKTNQIKKKNPEMSSDGIKNKQRELTLIHYLPEPLIVSLPRGSLQNNIKKIQNLMTNMKQYIEE